LPEQLRTERQSKQFTRVGLRLQQAWYNVRLEVAHSRRSSLEGEDFSLLTSSAAGERVVILPGPILGFCLLKQG